MNNAEALSGNSQAVSNFMALWNQEIIPRDNISGTDNSKGNLISHEKISGIDNFGKNLSLENEEKVNAKAEAKAKEKTEDARADAEAKTRVEAEAKAKEDQFKRIFNLFKSKLINEHHNLSKYQRLHPEEKMGIKELQSYINFRLKSTKYFHAKLTLEEDLARYRVLDTSLLTRRSMWVELINLSTKARQTAEILYKKLLSDQMCKTKKEAEAYNILKSEEGIFTQSKKPNEQEQAEAGNNEKGHDVKSRQQGQEEADDIIKAEQVRAVTEQDYKSEQQQQYEAKGIIRAEQDQGTAKEDGKSEQDEQDEAHDSIKTEEAQAITEQDSKSEQQEQGESDDIIKTEQAKDITEQDGKSEEQDESDDIIKTEQAQGITELDGKPEQQQQYKAKGIIRAEQAQGIEQDGKSEPQQQYKEDDIIKAEQDQGIIEQDGKSEQQQQDEAHDIIKVEQAEGINKQDGKLFEELTTDKEEADQVKPSNEKQNRSEEELQSNNRSTDKEEADQVKPSNEEENGSEEELQSNKRSTDRKEADQVEPSNEEKNIFEEKLQGKKQATHQGKPPNEEQNKIDKEVCGKRTSDEEEDVQTHLMQVAESTDAQEKDLKVDQESKLVEPSSEEQNRIEGKLQGNKQPTYSIQVDQEEDQESGQADDQGKSSNEGKNRIEEEVQGKIVKVEEATNACEDQKIGQDERSKYGFIDAIITNTEAPTGKIKIKYDVSQPRSLLSRKLANSLRTCFKCNDSNIAFVNLCVPSMYGFSYIQWHFDTSKNLKDECVLGQDYLTDRNISPLMLYRIMNLASQR